MSDSLLLDTDVASYLFKNSPRAEPFRQTLKGQRPVLAFVSVAELYQVDAQAPLGAIES